MHSLAAVQRAASGRFVVLLPIRPGYDSERVAAKENCPSRSTAVDERKRNAAPSVQPAGAELQSSRGVQIPNCAQILAQDKKRLPPMDCGESRRKVHMGIHLYGIANEKNSIEKNGRAGTKRNAGVCKIGYQNRRGRALVRYSLSRTFLWYRIASNEHSLRKKSPLGCAMCEPTA